MIRCERDVSIALIWQCLFRARIKRHAPRCDLQATSCHHARSRLNSACMTRFGNAILAHRIGIPIMRRVGAVLASPPSACEEEFTTETFLPLFPLSISPSTPSSSFSLIATPFSEIPLHPSPSAKCKTHVESSERSCEKRSTLATLK